MDLAFVVWDGGCIVSCDLAFPLEHSLVIERRGVVF